jgi:alkylated DNA repair dioxygenase AlkB
VINKASLKKTGQKVKINLPHGYLLLMGAGDQENWQHSVAKVKQLDEPRVNFTFRYMASNN